MSRGTKITGNRLVKIAEEKVNRSRSYFLFPDVQIVGRDSTEDVTGTRDVATRRYLPYRRRSNPIMLSSFGPFKATELPPE